jgi:isochorismate synthase
VSAQLRAVYPSCMLFAVDGFVGASPELLVSRLGDVVRSHPMAGTAPRSSDPSTDARLAANLLASSKDRIEHRYTIDMVHDTLLPWCSFLDEEAEPSIVAMANVQHLATLVEGRLSSPPASVIELMRALHPTPAVNGTPRDVALALIATHEGVDRGRYAGPVGWVDADGNGEWAVGIRSAELDGTRARVFAGVGVVADSDPDAELAETRAKFQALLGAIIRP